VRLLKENEAEKGNGSEVTTMHDAPMFSFRNKTLEALNALFSSPSSDED
jgi:hypothetical protein